jgi:hypothetical protein
LTRAACGADNGVSAVADAAMHVLALVIELAAIVTPVIGIVVELRRDISDEEGGGLRQGGLTPAPLAPA